MRLIASLALAGLLATSLAAQEMTDAERAAFRAEVRAYLLDNPEVLMEAIGILEQRQANAEVARDMELVRANADALFFSETSFVGGNPDGDITVVEFLDYRCGYCKRAHPEVGALLNQDTNIRYVIKELPILGEASVFAARYALAVQAVAGDDIYYDVHNTMMSFEGNLDDRNLARISATFGLDHDAITAEMNSAAVDAVINENRQLAAQLSISGTPSFVLGDQLMRGYAPLARMEQIIAEQRAASQDG